ncbi:unnamed protein product [Auanema sp. JU1783]|nr:unnamed protein product [Auanema sp. JU1783]
MVSSKVWFVILQICICLADDKPSDIQLQAVEVVFTTNGTRDIDSIEVLDTKSTVLEYTLFTNTTRDYFVIKPSSQHFAYKDTLTISFKYKNVKVTPEPSTSSPPTPKTTPTPTPKPTPTASFNATITIKPDSKNPISTASSSTNCDVAYSEPSTDLGKNVTVTLTYSLIARTTTTQKVNKHTSAVVVAVIEGLIIAAIIFVFLYKTYNKMKLRTAGMPYNDNNINSAFSSNLNNHDFYSNNHSSRSNNPVVQSPDYRYNQPLEMSNHASPSQLPRGPTRTESQTPTLVPVSTNHTQPQPQGEDPLRAWELH